MAKRKTTKTEDQDKHSTAEVVGEPGPELAAETKPEPEKPVRRECSTIGCGHRAVRRGLCDLHWATRRGDADKG